MSDHDDSLAALIDEHADSLIDNGILDRRILLHAIAEVESGHGDHWAASRHEPSYCYGSILYKGPNGMDLREQSQQWGCLAHSSFGSFQIMFISAFEMGFRGDPIALRNDFVGIPHVISLINRRILGKYTRIGVERFADAYNSGRPDDDRIPADYIKDFVAAYTKWQLRLDPPQVLHA